MTPNITVVILAAGLGTRMRSNQAKVLHEAGGQSLVEHVLDAAAEIAPPADTFIVIGRQADRVRALLAPRNVEFIHQADQLGTGHALLCGREVLAARPGALMVLNGDGPLLRAATLQALLAQHVQSGAAATIMTAELEDPTGYGRVVRGEDQSVLEVVEQKAATPEQLNIRESNTGQYCFDAALFWQHIGELTTDNPAGEYYLTDMIGVLIRAGKRVEAFRVPDVTEIKGINNRVELAEVDRIFRDRKVRELMLDGVTIERPETVTVDQSVSIGMDTVVEPFARILGTSRIGANCRIGAGAIVRDSELAEHVHIGPYTIVNDSRIGAAAHVGPFARLRLGNLVGAGAHIGNFVELKKAELAEGVKAGHLAYLGDCLIGERTNIGAGTITCNFDGFTKHRTSIGADAFIGSNSTLVAPIAIEQSAYVAAGSVITDPVPGGALALGRARQVVKEGWALKRQKERGGG